MKAGWTRAALGEICQIVGGGTPKTSVPAYWRGDIRWATPKDLSNQRTRYISDTGRSITDAGLNSSGAKILPAGSVLLSSRAPIGLVAINTMPMATNQGFKSLVPKNGQIDTAFLAYWLSANTRYLQSLGSGATFKEISKAVVEKIEIPVPPLAEQRRIARILDLIVTLQRRQRKAVAAAASIVPASFYDTFGDPIHNSKRWLCASIKEVGTVVTGNTPPRSEPRNYGGEIGWVKSDNISDDSLYVLASAEHLSQLGATRARIAPPGSILITCISGSPSAIGRVALATNTLAFNQQINAVIPTDIDPRFLCTQLRLMRPLLRSISTGGMKGLISKRTLEGVEVIVPPREQQEAFGRGFDLVGTQLRCYQQRSKQATKLFSSLQYRAFNGEL